MGLFDLPAPLFAWIDRSVAWILPPALVLVAWAALAAIASMEVYRLLSPQARIAGLKADLNEAQHALGEYDGEFAGAWLLIRRMLGLALARVGIVLPASLAATLPLVMLIVWLDTSYARILPPPGDTVAVVAPSPFEGRWIAGEEPPRARVSDGNGETVAEVAIEAPVPVVHKRRWWNALIGNPAGYIADGAPVDSIALDLPRREVLAVGPSWTRSWEAVFFPVLIVMAVGFKFARRIQ